MERMEKVQCTVCDRKYHLYEYEVPAGVKEGEAFPSECAFCEKGRFAVLAEDEKR